MNLAAVMLLGATLATNVAKVEKRYERVESKQLVPMLSEVVRFPTYANNAEGHAEQKAWLMKTAAKLGFIARDAGKVTEIELPATKGENPPILGLVVHGDVQAVDAEAWSFPPFGGTFDSKFVYGRGSADDKGPLVQALLAMKSLKETGIARTHTIRLLVGSEEESSATEMKEYLEKHAAPDYSLVLDSEFPVVVGEKAWNALAVTANLDQRGAAKPYWVADLTAGLGPSIVPDRAEILLEWQGTPEWEPLVAELKAFPMPEGTRLATQANDNTLRIVAYGKSSHSGVNPRGGRNALVALARALEGHLPEGGANDLLAFARTAGKDLVGTGLDLHEEDPVWGNYTVNVATIKPVENAPASRILTINVRRIPPRTGPQLEAHLGAFVTAFNQRTGASLQVNDAGSYWDDEPLGFDPQSKIVKRLLASYGRATGEKKPKPAISGGGTYAKRLPNAIAFGMWFPGKPYPGHDVDEKMPIADLQRGTRVLIDALVDLATGPRIVEPFGR